MIMLTSHSLCHTKHGTLPLEGNSSDITLSKHVKKRQAIGFVTASTCLSFIPFIPCVQRNMIRLVAAATAAMLKGCAQKVEPKCLQEKKKTSGIIWPKSNITLKINRWIITITIGAGFPASTVVWIIYCNF